MTRQLFEHLRQPDFESLVATLFNKKSHRVPLIELGIHPRIKAEILGRPIAHVRDDIEFMSRMGYDFVKIQPKIQMDTARQVGGDDAAPDRAWAAEHCGVIQSMADFEKYPWPARESIDYTALEQARDILPEGMGVIGQYGDIYTTAWEMMGFENFAVALYEDPELIEALFAKIGDLILSMFENMAQMEWVGCLWYSDDIAYTGGLMIGPDILRHYHFPNLKKIGDLAKKRGIPFIYHTDGVLWEVFEDIIACGVTAMHPIEPKSMDIVEVKQRVGDRLCVCGNIDVDLLARGKPEQIAALTRTRLEQLGPGGGYCLGSSNSVPDYAKVDNYLTMVKTALEHDLR